MDLLPIPIISNGHGGLINKIYQTRGKRSPIWSDGSQLFEGEFNRAIVARVIEALALQGIPYYQLTPENKDTHRTIRANRANKFHKENGKNTFLLDIHSNAAPKDLVGKGHGSEVHIAEIASRNSKVLAKIAKKSYRAGFPDERFRGIKRRNWTIVKKTAMPAMLIECFFMDNESDCKRFLMNKGGRDMVADWVLDIIYSYRNSFIINN